MAAGNKMLISTAILCFQSRCFINSFETMDGIPIYKLPSIMSLIFQKNVNYEMVRQTLHGVDASYSLALSTSYIFFHFTATVKCAKDMLLNWFLVIFRPSSLRSLIAHNIRQVHALPLVHRQRMHVPIVFSPSQSGKSWNKKNKPDDNGLIIY